MKNNADEYETIISTDENGAEKEEAVYRGAYFQILLDQAGIFQFRRTSFLLFLGIVILHVSAGFVSNQGMYQLYIALPYTIAFFPLLYLGMAVFRLPKEKRKVQSDEIRLSYDRIKINSIILLILFGVGGLGEIVYLVIFSVTNQLGLEFLFLGLELFAAGFVFVLLRNHHKIVIQPCDEKLSQENM